LLTGNGALDALLALPTVLMAQDFSIPHCMSLINVISAITE